MSHVTLFIILDACRADYVRGETMPFVHGLSKRSITGSFESPPGFAQRTVLFSGRYPDTSGNFSAFVYDPEKSPFRWVRRLGPLSHLVRPRRALFPARAGIARLTKWFTGTYHTDPAWIPPRFLPFFRPCEDMRPIFEAGALGTASLFDLCRQTGNTFRYLAHPVSGNDEEVNSMLVGELRSGKAARVITAQFSVTDQEGHKHSPFGPEMQEKVLPALDEKLAAIHAALSSNYDSWDLFLCGDHGMAPVVTRFDVLGALRPLSARPAKDYVVFVNSTLAVFWYLTERGRREVEALLPYLEGTRLLETADRKRLRIPTDRRWGDRMLAADPGVLFWPDYFHVKDSRILGMHGYLEKHEEGLGAMVLASSNPAIGPRRVGRRPLVDVFPTLCDLAGLPLPSDQEGESLLGARPRAPVPPQTVPALAVKR